MMRRGVRRGVVLAVVAAASATLLVAGASWCRAAKDQRVGQILAAEIASRTGLAIGIDGARIGSSGAVLHGVRVVGGSVVPLDALVGRVEIDAAAVPPVALALETVSLLAPEPRLTAMSAASTPSAGPSARGLPTAATLEALREQLLATLQWPAGLSVRLLDGELRTGGAVYRFDVAGRKVDPRTVMLSLALREHGAATLRSSGTVPTRAGRAAPAQMTMRARATSAGRAVEVALELDGDPIVVAALWPQSVPAPASLAARASLTMQPGGNVAGRGRVTFGGASPLAIAFTSSYDATGRRLSLPRYLVEASPSVRITGKGEIGADGRMTITANGTVDGSRITANAAYGLADASFDGDATIAPFEALKLGPRLGLSAPRLRAVARTVGVRASGIGGRVNVELLARDVSSDWQRGSVDAALSGTARLEGGSIATIERSTLTLSRDGQPLAVGHAGSRTGALWPLALDAQIADLSRLSPLLLAPIAVSGSARIVGELGASADGRGEIDLDVSRAELTLGAPVALSGLRMAVPFVWGGARSDGAGSIGIARVAAFGLVAEQVTGTAAIADGRLVIPDLAYLHYGGRGGGWLEVALDGDAEPFRARVEGEHVDLAAVARGFGSDLGRITGRVRYQANAQYSAGTGFVAAAHLDSEEDGGEISIDAIQTLLDSPAVDVESTGLLRRTLENLRVFSYASLGGDFRWNNGSGHIDLALRGQKRFGIFPAPVEAINIKNMPLSMLTRLFKPRTP